MFVPSTGSIDASRLYLRLLFNAQRKQAILSLVLGVLESLGTIYIGFLLDRDAIAFVFLITILMLRPQGLFGRV